MSKGNLFLGTASGKVGDVVFSRQGGEQITRVRNRSPKNPQTPLQMAQRVILSTVGKAYSLFAPIADHAFQGKAEGTECQSRFTERNVALLRRAAAEALNDGSPEAILSSQATNFSSKGQGLPVLNPYVIAEGSLPAPVVVPIATYGAAITLASLANDNTNPTYQQLCDALGANRGDQLTIVIVTTDNSEAGADAGLMNGFHYARIILEPNDGDMTSDFVGTGAAINKPNAKNEGDITVQFVFTGGAVQMTCRVDGVQYNQTQYSLGAMGAILSRKSGELWQRSNSALTLVTAGFDTQIHYLGDAVMSYMSEAGSSLYLNQAENF